MESMENHASFAEEQPCPPPPSTPRKNGGWRAIKYILGNESFEKLASISLNSNITLYLRSKYNLQGVFLVNVVSIWGGSCNILSLLGAFVADVYLGKFLTLLFGTIFSLLGMGVITLTAGIPELRPPQCPGQLICTQPERWQLAFLFVGLALVAVGAGGIRPCNIGFGADQFNANTEKGKKQLASFFNWWYFSFTIALAIALLAVGYIQTYVSWLIGYAVPTACFGLSITIFLMGRRTYVCKKPQGSVFVDMVKVVSAAFRKRKINASDHAYYDPNPLVNEEESDEQVAKTERTEKLKFFDKAATIFAPNELNEQGLPRNSWRLCSVKQVEQLKCLIQILPIWFSSVGCLLVLDQQNTFGILQMIQTNRKIGSHFEIPPLWMLIISMVSLSIWILFYECIYIPIGHRTFKKSVRLSVKQRLGIGILISIICMVVAGITEKKRRESALEAHSFVAPITFAIFLPQFMLVGLTEALGAIAAMELFTMQMPETMRSVSGAVFFLSLSAASYLSTLLVNVIHKLTGWIGGPDLNSNRLEYYYFLIAGLQVLNLIYYTFFASRFVLNSEKVTSRSLRELPGDSPISYYPRTVSNGIEIDEHGWN